MRDRRGAEAREIRGLSVEDHINQLGPVLIPRAERCARVSHQPSRRADAAGTPNRDIGTFGSGHGDGRKLDARNILLSLVRRHPAQGPTAMSASAARRWRTIRKLRASSPNWVSTRDQRQFHQPAAHDDRRPRGGAGGRPRPGSGAIGAPRWPLSVTLTMSPAARHRRSDPARRAGAQAALHRAALRSGRRRHQSRARGACVGRRSSRDLIRPRGREQMIINWGFRS